MLHTEGWIKLHRALLYSDIFDNEKLLKIFIWCILKATHSYHEQIVGRQIVKLNSGEFVFGRKKAANELGYSESTLWSYMQLLESKGTICIKSTNKFSIITVVNWNLYQSSNQLSNNKKTIKKQQSDTNKNVNKENINIYDETNEIYIIAKEYVELIRKHNPTFNQPDLQLWSHQIDNLIKYQKRNIKDIKDIMKWCQNDSFWKSKTLNIEKLSKHYDQLLIQMNSYKNKEDNLYVRKNDYSNMTPEQIIEIGTRI